MIMANREFGKLDLGPIKALVEILQATGVHAVITHWRKVWSPKARRNQKVMGLMRKSVCVALYMGPYLMEASPLRAIACRKWTPLRKKCSAKPINFHVGLSFKMGVEPPFDPREYVKIELKTKLGNILRTEREEKRP